MIEYCHFFEKNIDWKNHESMKTVLQWNQPRKWFRLFVLHFPLTYRLKIQTTGSSYDPSKVCDVQDRLSWILKKFLSFFWKKWKKSFIFLEKMKEILHFFEKNERWSFIFFGKMKDLSLHFFEKNENIFHFFEKNESLKKIMEPD